MKEKVCVGGREQTSAPIRTRPELPQQGGGKGNRKHPLPKPPPT
jgi:hypothetical protein